MNLYVDDKKSSNLVTMLPSMLPTLTELPENIYTLTPPTHLEMSGRTLS